jgi:hypothetical protein
MTIHTCDKCNNKIKGKPVLITLDMFWHRVELCEACAQPVIVFLKKESLFQEASAA